MAALLSAQLQKDRGATAEARAFVVPSPIWPASLRTLVRDRSETLGGGRYRVRGGTEHDPSEMSVR